MRRQKGFTLVELVVVVMILGILAAVAAPKLLGTSSAATDNGLKQTLGVVRDAIERYAAEYGKLPGDGQTAADFKADIKPFLRGEFPTCPVAGGDADVKITTDKATPLAGSTPTVESWHYNSGSGQFICNHPTATANENDDPGLTYDQL